MNIRIVNIRFNALVIFTVLLSVISCSSNSTKSDEKIEVKRFFSDDSFWNQPIAEDVEIDARSDYWISLLDRDPSGENIGLNIDSHTIPIYEVDSKNTIFQKIEQTPDHQTIPTHFMHHVKFDKLGVPMPENMTPAAGGDMHVAIIDWAENRVWDMFLVTKHENGNWSSATGMVYDLDGSGVFDKINFDIKSGESIHGCGPGVAAGMPIIAGVIRYDEVLSGEIRHKLAGALRYVAFQEYVYPATWTDGNFKGGIPEGAVIQLDPNLDLSQFDLNKSELVVAKAFQEYGCVVTDFSVGTTVRAEWLGGNADKTWEGTLRGWSVPGGIKTIPVTNYRILKVENMQKGGDKMKDFFVNQLYFEGDSVPGN